jgi:putative ATP-binding cassette transporter
MKLFQFLLRSNARLMVIVVVVSVISGFANAGLVALIERVWAWGAFTDPKWIGYFIAVLVVLLLSGIASQLMVLSLSLRAISDLRLALSARMLATPLRKLEELGPPKLLAVLTDDVQVISRVLPNVPRIVIDGTTLVAGIAYMGWLSLTALTVIVVFALVGVGIYRLLMRDALRHMRRGREVYDTLFGHFRALDEGLKQLKINRDRRREFLENDLSGAVEDFRSSNYAGRALLIGAENVTRLLFFVLLGALMFAVPRMIGVSGEVLRGFVLMALYLYRPLSALMTVVPELARASVSLQKVEKLGLTLDGAAVDPADGLPVEAPPWKSITLSGVTYSYHREREDSIFTVGPVDLEFHPGELVFIVGGNGGGKTTLAKLVSSLYPPDSGEIRLDGKLVTKANVESYRQLFSAVFTDFHVFPRLLTTEGGADVDKKAEYYLRKLHLDHKVTVEGGRLSTTALSTGQRKRLALLAAYLEDRPFYVFDEWAADQDPQFKDVFYTQLLPELKSRGKTVLVITHDDRYLAVADRVLKLVDGQVQAAPLLASTGEARP